MIGSCDKLLVLKVTFHEKKEHLNIAHLGGARATISFFLALLPHTKVIVDCFSETAMGSQASER